MYPRNLLCGEAKINRHTFSKKKPCEIDEETMWKSRIHAFFLW